MADSTKRPNHTRARTGSRLGPIGDSIRERPLATAAVATAAAAAGAFFFARRSGVTTDTVAKWGQDAKDELASLTGHDRADSDNATGGAAKTTGTPSSDAAGKLAETGSAGFAVGGESGGKPAAGKSTSALSSGTEASARSGNTGLDETVKDQSEVGSVAYGA